MRADAGHETHRAFVLGADQRRAAATTETTASFKLTADDRDHPRRALPAPLEPRRAAAAVERAARRHVARRPAAADRLRGRALPASTGSARFAVKPGITGLWQVSGRSELTLEEMIALDLEYVRRRSLWLNLEILLADGARRAARARGRRDGPPRPVHQRERAGPVGPARLERGAHAARRRLGGRRRLRAGRRPPRRAVRGHRGHRDPPLPARARRRRAASATPASTGRRCGASAGWRGGSAASARFDVVHACNPPDFLLLAALGLRRKGARFVFDHHDLVPELYRSKFGQDGPLYRVAGRARADPVPAGRRRRSPRTAPTGGSRSSAAASRPTTVFVVRNGPDLERFRPAEPDPAWRRGREHLLAYLGIMGPQDGLDHALRGARPAARACATTGTRCSSARATCSRRCAALARAARDRRPRRVRRLALRRRHPHDPVDRRRVPRARPAEPAQRRLDDDQDPRVHGDGLPDRRPTT